MGVTIKDVAERAGSSVAAVSYVINNKRPEAVSHQVRERVVAAIEELGYKPHGIARGLVLQKSHNIGVGMNDLRYLHDVYFSTIVSEIGCVVGLHDYNLQFTVTNEQPDAEQRNLFFVRKVDERRVDGLIIIDQQVSDEVIREVAKRDIPLVLVDRHISGMNCNSVIVDNSKGMFMATEHLIRLGHRRIGIIVEAIKHYSVSEKLKGYREGLAQHGLTREEDLVKVAEGNTGDEYGATERLLDMSDRPTAILLGSDLMVASSFQAVKKRGLKIPGDIAFVSFNDTLHAISIEPRLSSVRVPLQRLGRQAAQMLFKLIDGEEVDERQVVLEPRLVVRDSCGAKDSAWASDQHMETLPTELPGDFVKRGGESD